MFRPRSQPTRRTRLSVQALEDRSTPASAFVDYTDIDGDLVRITASKPGVVAPPLDAADLTLTGGLNGQLLEIKLFDPDFEGAKIVISATRQPGGDGLVHVGYVNATLRDLDQVIVKGDVGRIRVGDLTLAHDPGLNLLEVRSLGTLGLVTGAPDLVSVVRGKLGAVKVTKNVTDATLMVLGSFAAEIGSVAIGGDLVGGTALSSGRIYADGSIGQVSIGGDVRGGAGNYSGQIYSEESIGKVRIGGDLLGGAGDNSGAIDSQWALDNVRIGGDVVAGAGDGTAVISGQGPVGKVTVVGDVRGGLGQSSAVISSPTSIAGVYIGGDLLGGSNLKTGVVFSLGTLGNVHIRGDVIGGSMPFTGAVASFGDMGQVRIDGNLIGGSIFGAASLSTSGVILTADGRIAGVSIGGSLIAGVDNSTGSLNSSGAIISADDIGPIRIGLDIVGNTTNNAVICAEGKKVKPGFGADLAIASLIVGGNVSFAKVLGGFDDSENAVNADASIGSVAVAGNWIASSIVAGAQNLGTDDAPGGSGLAADNVNFADDHNVGQSVENTGLIAQIKSIKIGGTVVGTLLPDDHFGFVAQHVGSLSIGGVPIALTAGPSLDKVSVPFVDDLAIVEIL